MLSPGGEPVSDGKARTHRSYKVAELMGVEPISAGLWMQAQMLPWVLHRVNTLLAALPLTQGWEDKVLTMEMILSMAPTRVLAGRLPGAGELCTAGVESREDHGYIKQDWDKILEKNNLNEVDIRDNR